MKLICATMFVMGMLIMISSIIDLGKVLLTVKADGSDEAKEYSLNRMVSCMNSCLGCILMFVSGLTLLF